MLCQERFTLMCVIMLLGLRSVRGDPAPPPVQTILMNVTSVPINTNASIKALPATPKDAPSVVTWLGCLQLQALSATSLFGGLLGSAVRGSRLLMVSDTTKNRGSGRFLTGDIKMGPASAVNDEKVLPLDLENVTVQPLQDEHGDFLVDDKASGDTESLGVKWPAADDPSGPIKIIVGVERKHVVRIYNVPSGSGSLTSRISAVTPLLMPNSGSEDAVGAQLKKCSRGKGLEENNFGAEGTAFVSDDQFVVFCEYNKPDGDDGTTIGWMADYKTGTITAAYTVALPPVPGSTGKFMRISSVVAVPDTSDLMFLFHYWSKASGDTIMISRATLPKPDKNLSPKELKAALLMGPLKKKDGFPVDNMETLNVVATETKGTYVIHILSDNNFQEKWQNTYLLSLLMRDAAPAAKPATAWEASGVWKRRFEAGIVYHWRAPHMSSLLLVANVTLTLGIVMVTLGFLLGFRRGRNSQRSGYHSCPEQDKSLLVDRATDVIK